MVFHVLNRGNAKAKIFDGAGDYAAFERVLADVLALFSVDLLCYCLMPNHWHLVLRPSHDRELGRFMQRLTVTHVRRWHQHRHSNGEGHLYQGTYKSFPVQQDRHLLTLCRYVERNPLKAKLVRRAENWQWSSLWRRMHDEDSAATPLPPLSPWPVPIPNEWLKMVNTTPPASDLEALELSFKRGRPFGAEIWQKRTAATLGLASSLRPRGRPRKRPDKK